MILSALVFITLAGGGVMVWYTYRMQDLLTHMIERNVAAFEAAEALENALINQKGFVSYYFLDADPDWLRRLGEYRQIFRERLKTVEALVGSKAEKEGIARIDSEYERYITLKDRVINHYKAGKREAGAEIHKEVRTLFFNILDLCEKYKALQKSKINQMREQSRMQAEKLRIIALTAMAAVLILGVLLTFVLVHHILGPIRKLVSEADGQGGSYTSPDEVKALSLSVKGLIQDMHHTHFELERSRESLLQAEKMALVGKLAAGTSHSIRNPLTSVKMRLFSLSRSLDLSEDQKEDFQVISDEIRHIDTIVQNFLEFSRPPKLTMQKISPSDVVDMTIQLLTHRLQSYDVHIELDRQGRLPLIQADLEQLKEVLVNLIVNACEAMIRGGTITIQEEVKSDDPRGEVVLIKLSDTGPGIPSSLQNKVLQPFFTTKEEGTGLGLSIAVRILEQHGGWLELLSKEGQGATFLITLPVMEDQHEHHSGH